jgi:hypothetical protein
MEDVGIVYARWVYFTAIGYILQPFSIFYGHLVHFWYIFPVLVRCSKKNPTFTHVLDYLCRDLLNTRKHTDHQKTCFN